MIQGISLLLGFQLAGEVVKRLAHVPVPGPVIGLLLLFAFLQARTFVDLKTSEDFDTSAAAQVATPLLRHLAVLFVPSGVGVLEYFEQFAQQGLAVVFVLAVSTLVTMAAAALAFAGTQSLAKRLREERSIYRRASLGLHQSIITSIVSPERKGLK
jgi:holin-like protein